ncbi:MAG: hypothetical protein JWR55_1521 [Aeromicrobium sp.]|jgi:hypothetical protein|nr:hypothetical protein [Aeromicrobium sp.]
MALELRPNCESCDLDLPAGSQIAMICTYECTFCLACVDGLRNVCPNCGGGFTPRPIRPSTGWRPGLSLAQRPASTVRVHMSRTAAEAAELSERLAGTPPSER